MIYSSVITSGWLGKGEEKTLTDYFCLLSAPEYELGFFQQCLFLTSPCLMAPIESSMTIALWSVCFSCYSSKQQRGPVMRSVVPRACSPGGSSSLIFGACGSSFGISISSAPGQGSTEVGMEICKWTHDCKMNTLPEMLWWCAKASPDRLRMVMSLEDALVLGSFFVLRPFWHPVLSTRQYIKSRDTLIL